MNIHTSTVVIVATITSIRTATWGNETHRATISRVPRIPPDSHGTSKPTWSTSRSLASSQCLASEFDPKAWLWRMVLSCFITSPCQPLNNFCPKTELAEEFDSELQKNS
jgi:hypothetical protein